MTDSVIPYEPSPIEARQAAHIAAVPELYRTTHERLAVELALHMDDAADIFASYHYTPDQAAALCESPPFIALLERVTKEVRENGLSFKAKIKAVAEDLIPTAYALATDPECSSAVRADLIKWSAKMSGYEPATSKDDKVTGGGLTLSITFAGQAPQQVVSARETLTIEQEA